MNELMTKEMLPRALGASDDTTPVENKAQLVEYLAAGCKPADTFRLGAEQEQFVYRAHDYRPATYDGLDPGIRALLEEMARCGWESVQENDLPIALRQADRSITLEPGGQLELSGAPLGNVHETAEETRAYHRQLSTLSSELGLRFLALGHQPKWSGSELTWMPKQRYRIMRDYMARQGSLGLEMMQSTCAMQVNLDFSSEADMVRKFRVALALHPLVTALFANSPFVRGTPSGYLSYRSRIWSETDHDRCGNLPFVFEEGMGFERYTDYVLDVPMYFVIREGVYLDASGLSFRDFLDGKLSVLPGQRPLLQDWVTHLSTVFPQVRLKKILEVRGADAGDSPVRMAALTALWAGILYDTESLEAAWERAKTWTPAEQQALETSVAQHGFAAPFRGGTVQDLCLWTLDLSRRGLQRRNRRNEQDQDESCYLAPLQEVAEAGQTFAEQLVRRFAHEWDHDIDIAIRTLCQETLS